MNLKDCYTTKMRWKEYEVGGRFYGLGGADYTNLVNKWKKEYADGGCGVDATLEECLSKEQYLSNVRNAISVAGQQNNISYVSAMSPVLAQKTKEFNESGCSAKINESKGIALQGKIQEYSAFDKQRIEAESKYEARKKIFIGGSVILVGLALIVVLQSE
jgi:hypothetical protein